MLDNLQLHLHERIRYAREGWNYYLSPFLGMLFYISVPGVLIAKLFPELLLGSTVAAVLGFVSIVALSYYLGIRHERLELLKKPPVSNG